MRILKVWRDRVPLSVQVMTYAFLFVLVVTSLQFLALGPIATDHFALVLVPPITYGLATWVITRGIIQRRASSLLAVYDAFRRGEVEFGPIPDAEFRESREIFVGLTRELTQATNALKQRDIERRRLFSDVVHEIGTPVSSLLGLAEALERPALVETPEQRARLAHTIAHESERLARFVEDLRDIAQLDDPAMVLHREPIALDELARDVVERLNAIPDASPVTVHTEPVEMLGDSARLEQILVNLVTNARRYAPKGAPIEVRVKAQGDAAKVVVEDGGPGVSDADLKKLGERMRRLDDSRNRATGGTGLGLSIVTAIAQRHDGRVAYRRSDLGGLAVDVTLPGSRKVGQEGADL